MIVTTRSHNVALSAVPFTNAAKSGWKVVVGSSNVAIVGVTRGSGSAATNAYIYASDKTTQLATSTTIHGDTFEFLPGYTLIAGTTYYIVVDGNGSNYTDRNRTGLSGQFPYNLTELSITASVDNGAAAGAFGGDVTNQMYSIYSVDIYRGESVQETGTIGTRVIRKDYPITRGLSAGTTKHLVDSHDYDADTDT